MLSAVGHAVAVSPDIALMRAAAQPVVDGGVEDQADHPALAAAPLTQPENVDQWVDCSE